MGLTTIFETRTADSMIILSSYPPGLSVLKLPNHGASAEYIIGPKMKIEEDLVMLNLQKRSEETWLSTFVCIAERLY